MNFDLRFPIGALFSFYGVTLVLYGLATNNSEVYQRSLGINVNLAWGLVLLVFGVAMLWLAWRARRRAPEAGAPSEKDAKPKTPPTVTLK
jgi:type VI protein secretion system component VasK